MAPATPFTPCPAAAATINTESSADINSACIAMSSSQSKSTESACLLTWLITGIKALISRPKAADNSTSLGDNE